MSMNFSEFTRWLKSDPASQDPEYQAARRSGPEFIAAAEASSEFEAKLRRATHWPVPPDLGDSIKALARETPTGTRSVQWRWSYALAASLLLALAAVLAQRQMAPQYDSVEDYVAYHFSHDGPRLLDLAGNPGNAPQPGELAELLASLDLSMAPQLAGRVQYVKYCPTPEGRGVHLVMNTDRGLVTVIFMPDQAVQDGERFAFDGMEASLVSLPGRHAAAAVVGRAEQLDPAFSLALQDAMLPAVAGT